jgi:hypothetical protein
MRTGLIAAGLALLAAAVLVNGGRAGGDVSHTCSATDRDFLQTAETNMMALGLWGEQYGRGDATAAEVVAEARKAARRVGGTKPSDPSLQRTRTFMEAMLDEYARAVHAKERNRDASGHMYRAYGLANFARDTLVDASSGLRKQGCDVTALL